MRIGNLDRQLASLAGPIFIETLLVMMLGGVDTFMLSRYSDNSVAAVGVVNQIMNLVFLLFEVISLGTSILCSQYIGAGRRDKVVQVVGIFKCTCDFFHIVLFSGCFEYVKQPCDICVNRILQSAARGESLVITDPKSELYEKTSEYLRAEGYEVKVFNLVTPEASDSWNCLCEIEGEELMAQREGE